MNIATFNNYLSGKKFQLIQSSMIMSLLFDWVWGFIHKREPMAVLHTWTRVSQFPGRPETPSTNLRQLTIKGETCLSVWKFKKTILWCLIVIWRSTLIFCLFFSKTWPEISNRFKILCVHVAKKKTTLLHVLTSPFP